MALAESRTPVEDVNKPLTPSEQRFVEEYVKDRNGCQAYKRAGHEGASDNSARAAGSRLLAKRNVRAAVEQRSEELLRAVQQETGITLERTLREIARGAFFDARKLFDHNGIPLAIQDLDDETASVLAGMDVLEEYRGTGEDREFVGYVKKYKLSERKGYLDMLMKHLGGYANDKDVNLKVEDVVRDPMDTARRVAFILQAGLKAKKT